MPRFSYKCPSHGEFQLSLEKRDKSHPCPTCGGDSVSIIKAGTTRIVERLDNGLMAKVVERLHNVEEIMEERNDRHSRGSSEDT